MKCEQCKRQLTAAEPVYRLFVRVNWQMACGACEAAASKACAFPPLWRLPRCCSQCARGVYMDSLPRKARYFVCGAECRRAAHKASYRRMHPPSPRVERQCLCGVAFTPKRDEAKFCSAACKQRAYRERLTTIQRRPASDVADIGHVVDLCILRHVPTTCVHDLVGAVGLSEMQERRQTPAATLLQLAPLQRPPEVDK